MKLSKRITFVVFVVFSAVMSITLTKEKSNLKSKVLPVLTPMATYITDKSSIWEASSTVDVLVTLSKEITKPEVSDKMSKTQYQEAQAACLGTLKNLGGKWGNNMRYFWNAITDLIRLKDDKLIVEKTFEEAFAMCGQEKVTVASLAGQLCGKIFVMDFNADKAKKIITEALKKFNLIPNKKPVITSFIGTHRNTAPASFFKKMNGDFSRR